MAPQDIVQILQRTKQIREFDINARIIAQFPSSDFSAQQFGNLTIVQFIDLTRRLIDQFETELEGPNAAFLTRGYHWETSQHGMSHRHIFSVMDAFASHLLSCQWDAASQLLELGIGYQIQNGFWEKGSRRPQSLNRIRQTELLTELELRTTQIKELIKAIERIKADQQLELTKRQNDQQVIANHLAQAQNQMAELSGLLGRSNNENGQITQILNTQSQNLDRYNQELVEIGARKTQLDQSLANASKQLNESEERLKFMTSKADWVNELAGTAAAGVLGQKFEARMRELAKASTRWMWGTVCSVVLGAVWLWIAHKYITRDCGDMWSTFALNFGLLLPSLFIVGFFAKQFGKVRQFEEEYAFRSSVAMTLGAFADRLASDDKEHNRLIMETVENLYKLPVLLQERETQGWLSRKSTERMLKATTDLVTAVKK